MIRCLPSVFFVLAIACFAWATYAYVTEDTGPGLEIPEPERELHFSAGETRELLFDLQNTGRLPVRVVGLAWC